MTEAPRPGISGKKGRAESSRVENIPYIAIEEAVVNAVYHRGYDVREPVEIRIMHDEWWS